jgi:hypothetical protein
MTLNKETALKRKTNDGRNVCGVVRAQPLEYAKGLRSYSPTHPPLCVGDVHPHHTRYEIYDFGSYAAIESRLVPDFKVLRCSLRTVTMSESCLQATQRSGDLTHERAAELQRRLTYLEAVTSYCMILKHRRRIYNTVPSNSIWAPCLLQFAVAVHIDPTSISPDKLVLRPKFENSSGMGSYAYRAF